MTDVRPVGTSNERRSPLGLADADLAALLDQVPYRRVPQIPTPAVTDARRADWRLLGEAARVLASTLPTDLAPLVPGVEAAHARALARLEAALRDHTAAVGDPDRRRLTHVALAEFQRDETTARALLGRLHRAVERQARQAQLAALAAAAQATAHPETEPAERVGLRPVSGQGSKGR